MANKTNYVQAVNIANLFYTQHEKSNSRKKAKFRSGVVIIFDIFS